MSLIITCNEWNSISLCHKTQHHPKHSMSYPKSWDSGSLHSVHFTQLFYKFNLFCSSVAVKCPVCSLMPKYKYQQTASMGVLLSQISNVINVKVMKSDMEAFFSLYKSFQPRVCVYVHIASFCLTTTSCFLSRQNLQAQHNDNGICTSLCPLILKLSV